MRNLILASLLGALSIVGCDTAESPTAPSRMSVTLGLRLRMSVRLGLRLLHRAWVAVAAVSRLKVWESGRSHRSLLLTSNFWTERRDNSSDRPCKTDYGRFNIFASWSSAGADEYELQSQGVEHCYRHNRTQHSLGGCRKNRS